MLVHSVSVLATWGAKLLFVLLTCIRALLLKAGACSGPPMKAPVGLTAHVRKMGSETLPREPVPGNGTG